MTERTDVLVVGGSIAGVKTAERLRMLKFEGSITVVEAGPDLPYDRPALSKQILTAGAGAASVRLRERAGLEKAGIDLRLGTAAAGLDLDRKAVRLAGGDSIEYGDLVIATGSAARTLPGARSLRTLADALALRAGIASAADVVVVGAGFIGSEVAAAAAGRDVSVTVVEPFAFPLGRVLGDTVGKRLARLHESKGVQLVPGRSVREVRGRVAILDDGTHLPADLVVAGIGAAPATGWLAGSGLDLTDGVACDEHCRAAPHVWAAGDVARWPNPLFGEVMRVEHWTNAVEQAAVVGWNIAKPDSLRAYVSVPYVWSDQHGVRLQIVGRPRPGDDVRVVLDEPGGAFAALYVRDGAPAGAFAMNAPARVLELRRALAARLPLSEVLATYE